MKIKITIYKQNDEGTRILQKYDADCTMSEKIRFDGKPCFHLETPLVLGNQMIRMVSEQDFYEPQLFYCTGKDKYYYLISKNTGMIRTA